nr:Arm DNA-binding domain-containing protein [Bacteroides thetaiotaomicron]
MKSTFKTLFYLKKNEPKKNGHVVIMVRITVDGDQVQFSSKLDIHPDNWDTKTGRAVINKQSADKKENLRVSYLTDTGRDTFGHHHALHTHDERGRLRTAGKNQERIPGIGGKEKTLISYFTQHNEQYAKKVGKTATQKTYSRYELTKQRMIEFLQRNTSCRTFP